MKTEQKHRFAACGEQKKLQLSFLPPSNRSGQTNSFFNTEIGLDVLEIACFLLGWGVQLMAGCFSLPPAPNGKDQLLWQVYWWLPEQTKRFSVVGVGKRNAEHYSLPVAIALCISWQWDVTLSFLGERTEWKQMPQSCRIFKERGKTLDSPYIREALKEQWKQSLWFHAQLW